MIFTNKVDEFATVDKCIFALRPTLHTQLKIFFFNYRQLRKLDEDSLTKQPEEVFDVLEKLGEG